MVRDQAAALVPVPEAVLEMEMVQEVDQVTVQAAAQVPAAGNKVNLVNLFNRVSAAT